MRFMVEKQNNQSCLSQQYRSSNPTLSLTQTLIRSPRSLSFSLSFSNSSLLLSLSLVLSLYKQACIPAATIVIVFASLQISFKQSVVIAFF